MESTKISLNDIGGFKEEKAFARRIINFLKNFDDYTKKGAYLPKGVLLLGKPGLGKTMLATAIADESGIPTYSLQGEGDSLVGENLLKSLSKAFEEAKKHVPSILILDDIANFLPSGMGMGMMQGSDRSKDVLNFILTQIDGIKKSDGVFIIATANDKWEVPEAIYRAGRLENVITFNMPSLEEREQICQIYLSKSDILSEVDPKELAVRMGEMTGAMIKRVINDGLIDALASNKKPKAVDFMPFIYSCMMEGLKKEGNPNDDKPTVIHELGHFICDNALNGNVGDVSIEQYSSTRGSYRRSKKEEETEIKSKSALYHDAVVSLAGLAAQEVILGEKYSGAYNDVKELIHSITKQTTSGLFGFDVITTDATTSYSNPEFNCSPMFHPFLNAYLSAAYQTAKNIIEANKGFIEKVTPMVLERKLIVSSDMEEIVKENPIYKNFEIVKMEKIKPFPLPDEEKRHHPPFYTQEEAIEIEKQRRLNED